MIDERITRASLAACRGQFPRTCKVCRRPFPTFAAFVEITKPIGALLDPIEDDEPIGLLGFANCTCNTTIALRYEDVREHAAFNRAVFAEAAASRRTDREVVTEFAEQVRLLARTPETAPPAAPFVIDAEMLEVGAALLTIIQRGTLSLPLAPTAALRVRWLALSDSAEPRTLADAIAADAGLAAAVLRAANSAQFAHGGEVTSLLVAISRLGMRGIADVAMSAGVGGALTPKGPFVTQRHMLWRRGVLTALLVKPLCQGRGIDPDDGFVAGLFSSLGAIVGTLAIEVLLAERPQLPAKPWTWWLRILEVFAGDFGKTASKAWALPSLIASVAADPHSIEPNAPAHVAVIAAANRVATLALDRPSVQADDLVGERAIRDEDRAILVKAVPACIAGLVAFTGPSIPVVANAAIAAQDVPDSVAPKAPLTAVIGGLDGVTFDVVGVGTDVVVLSGPQSLAEASLVAVELSTTPTLRFWATTTAVVASQPPRMVLTPFALDVDSDRRLKALVPNTTP